MPPLLYAFDGGEDTRRVILGLPALLAVWRLGQAGMDPFEQIRGGSMLPLQLHYLLTSRRPSNRPPWDNSGRRAGGPSESAGRGGMRDARSEGS